jgi:hypothetical protein
VPAFPRLPRASLVVGALSVALVVGSTASAQAATVKLHTVTADEAFATVPLAKAVPGDVLLAAKIETPGSAVLDPCPQLDFAKVIAALLAGTTPGSVGLNLKGTQIAAVYEPAHSQTPPAKTATWTIGAVVFHSSTLASAAAAKLAKIDKSCPKTTPPVPGFPFTPTLVRTKSAAYAVDGWTGYRTVDEDTSLNLINGPEPTGSRTTRVFLTRGNVMITIIEAGVVATGTAARQEAWRSTVTRGMLTSFDALIG